MLFTGNYDHLIDDKNRLSIPAVFRNQMNPETDGKGFYIVPGVEPRSLWLYAEKHFRRLSDEQRNELIPDLDQLEFEETLFSFAELVEMDSGGRILVPARHIQMAGLGKEVTLKGVRNHISIVNRADFDQVKEQRWKEFPAVLKRAGEAQYKRRQPGTSPD